jgi:hypothetical protein
MADRKISDLTALTAPAAGDYLPIVDISEVAAASKNKRITIEELFRGVPDGTAAAPAIAPESDPNTGIYSSGADQLSIATNGTERLRIDSAGQIEAVSLGTAAAPTFSFTGDPNTGIYSPGADQLAISTGGTGRLFVDANGNVGISTASITPVTGYRFLVINGVDGAVLSFQTSSIGEGAIVSYNQGANFSVGSVTSIPLIFYTNNTERMRLTSAGLLGLGTSSPGTLLDISVAGGMARIGSGSGNNLIQAYTGASGLGMWAGGSTRFYSSANITFSTNATIGTGTPTGYVDAMTIDSSGRVGIGTTSPLFPLDVNGVIYTRGRGSTFGVLFDDWRIYNSTAPGALVFDNGSERARIDSSGRLLVGTSSARANFTSGARTSPFQIEGTSLNNSALSILRNSNDTGQSGIYLAKSRSTTVGDATPDIVADGDSLGSIFFQGADNTNFVSSASITAQVDGTPGADDMPGRLVFSTTADGAASPTERMRINSAGRVFIGKTADDDSVGITAATLGNIYIVRDGGVVLGLNRLNSDGTIATFGRSNTTVGTISVTTTATAYNTSSDYRLKENVVEVTDGITRLQQLKPSRFNFIAAPGHTVDGFIAHEVQEVVSEAITGEKDAVDDDGNPVYQGIDQSKLVPLLTAALQEAIGEIESLKARVAALEGA